MANPQLVNAVGGGDLEHELDLQFLYEALDGEEVRYDPEYWPGLYVRFAEDSPAIMIFRTGKYNIAGADSIQQLHQVSDNFRDELRELGINNEDVSFEVRNLVFLDQYDKELELEQIAVALGLENTEYEPEQFPGALYRPSESTGTFLIFRNGKITLTGVSSSDDAVDAFDKLFGLLDNLFA